MSNIKITDYVALAEAGYADFSAIKAAENDEDKEREMKNAIKKLGKPGTVSKIINTATFNSEDNDKSTTEQFAEYLADKYEVAAHWKDRGNL